MPVDFYWTMDADFVIGPDGDIKDTSFDYARTYFQEARTRSRSDFQDWALHPSLGANLSELLGKMNNKMTAEEGKGKLLAAMVYGGFLRKEQVSIRYIPISKHQIVYFIRISIVVPEVGKSRMLETQILYDTQEGKMRVV